MGLHIANAANLIFTTGESMAEAATETRQEFHARRAKGIGGSDVAAIMGVDLYRDAEELWLEKTGQKVTHEDDTPTPDQQRGITFESVALKLYAEQSGTSFIPGSRGTHPEYPWMLYTTDATIIDSGEEIIGEVKCPSLGMFSRIKREGLAASWILQMQHYLCCTKSPVGRFIVFCADRMEILTFDVQADLLLHDLLIEKEREFWTLVETMTPPEPVVAEMKDGKVEIVGTVEKRYDDKAREAFTMLREAKAMKKTSEELEEQALYRVREVIGENRYGVFEAPGIGRLNVSQRAGRLTFDSKALANVRPLDRIAVGALLEPFFESGAIPVTLVSWLANADLDLAQFDKIGKPYDDVRFYAGRGE